MRLSQFLEESNGQLSSNRLAYLLWTVGVFAVWAYASVKAVSLAAIPETVLAGVAVMTGGKIIQKSFEKPKGEGEEIPTT